MPATWEHQQLGKFTYEDYAWVGAVEAPAFNVFTFDGGFARQREPNGTYEISFDADDENEKPSAGAVAVALEVLAAQDELPNQLMKALWNDFNGRGPKSGMWWHGQLDEVFKGIEDEDEGPSAPKTADSLRRLLRFSGFKVRNEVRRYEKPVVELSFEAAFEQEHGVGVLTDGKKILGTGYTTDVSPFKSK